MPALTTVTIEKVYNGEYWVNVYYLSVAIADASVPANAIVAAERAVTSNQVVFSKMSLRTTAVGDEVYATAPLNLNGLAPQAVNVPLFNVARIDFQAQVGRPSRKYLRCVFSTGHLSALNLSAERVGELNSLYAVPVAAITAYCDIDGDELIAGACSPIIGNRQLRRGSKKKVTP